MNVLTVGSYATSQVQATPFSCMDVDSETDSNHDTALTLACAGGHEDLVELLLSRGADIGERNKPDVLGVINAFLFCSFNLTTLLPVIQNRLCEHSVAAYT